MLRRAIASYTHQLLARPLATKARPPPASPPRVRVHFVRLIHGRRVCRLSSQAATSAALGGLGDLTCQLVCEERRRVDVRRLATFTALGGVMVGPTLHHWYTALHRHVPGEGVRALVRRLALDQLVFAPLFIPSFMGVLLVLEGHERPLRKTRAEWWPSIVANWQLWVPAPLVNFGLVPLHFQVLFFLTLSPSPCPNQAPTRFRSASRWRWRPSSRCARCEAVMTGEKGAR